VTAAQVKEIMNKYLTGKKKVVLEYLPEAMRKGPPSPAPAPPAKEEKKP
jgi:hypothetical protein